MSDATRSTAAAKEAAPGVNGTGKQGSTARFAYNDLREWIREAEDRKSTRLNSSH